MRIAFAACIRRETIPQQPVWRDVLAADPDCLVLLGDLIYMDYGMPLLSPEPPGTPREYSTVKFRSIMEAKYLAQWDEPDFRRLVDAMRAKHAFFATWGDHDFAWEDARGRSVPGETRQVSRKLFNRFVYGREVDAEIYRYVDFPLARIIVLDTRFYADEPGPEADLLGAAQWRFLEKALHHDRAYTVVCSGLTLDQGVESWARYPKALERLRALLALRNNVLFLSGDVHANSFRRHNGPSVLYELTSSGAAVNRLGLPFGIGQSRNWGLVELGEADVVVRLNSRRGNARHAIDAVTWREAP
ncbi:MAG: alkaline phosphatase D family protein [Burkholderiales bacterium]|nr:alkaline phosphatase D family protein [Burkholderiales bacterium]